MRTPLVSFVLLTAASFAAECKLKGIEKLLDSYEIRETRPVVRALPPEKVRELEKQAAQTDLPPLRILTSYWKLDVRHCPEKADEIVKRFSALNEHGGPATLPGVGEVCW